MKNIAKEMTKALSFIKHIFSNYFVQFFVSLCSMFTIVCHLERDSIIHKQPPYLRFPLGLFIFKKGN